MKVWKTSNTSIRQGFISSALEVVCSFGWQFQHIHETKRELIKLSHTDIAFFIIYIFAYFRKYRLISR